MPEILYNGIPCTFHPAVDITGELPLSELIVAVASTKKERNGLRDVLAWVTMETLLRNPIFGWDGSKIFINS